MDPRDPRAAGDDLPPPGAQVAARQEAEREHEQVEEDRHPISLPPLGPTEKELTERYGPPAPEPKWTSIERPFNRERFLLWFLATAMICQYAFLMVGTLLCFNVGRYRMERGLPLLTAEQNHGCRSIGDRLSTVFELSVSVVLALMVGSSVTIGTKPPPGDDPRRRGP